MTIDRAIEILDPEHREVYESIDPVNEACVMGQKALRRLKPLCPKEEEVVYYGDPNEKMIVNICPACKQRIPQKPAFCPNCGQALLWKAEEQ